MIFKEDSFIRQKENHTLIVVTVVALIVGTVVYHYLENWSWLDSIYFCIMTLTTVGYGDLAPQTDQGKIFTMFYVLTGIGIVYGFIKAFYSHRMEFIKKPWSLRKQPNNEQNKNS